jgi:hypothetical protein
MLMLGVGVKLKKRLKVALKPLMNDIILAE